MIYNPGVRWLLLFSIQICAACTAPVQVYKLYPGPELDASETAQIDLTSGTAIVIDGLNVSSVDYDRVEVAPGNRDLGRGFLYSIVRSEKFESNLKLPIACLSGQSEVVLEAGKTYLLRYARHRLEMLDAEAGMVVWTCESR